MENVSYDTVNEARDRTRDLLPPTPLIYSHALSSALDSPVWFKCEQFQVTGSFKVRGALNWVSSATEDELANGLLTLSAGNHALGLAWAARSRGVSVTVVMPEGSSPYKVRQTEALGAEVIIHGDINQAMDHTDELQKETGRTYVPPFDDERIIAGQGTLGQEIINQLPEVGRILAPVGGGGLVSGVGTAVKAVSQHIELIGFEPENAATLSTAWEHGGPVRLEQVNTIAASLGASLAGEITYPVSRRVVDSLETVSEDDIRFGFRAALEHCKLMAEPGSVLPIAALLRRQIPVDKEEPTVVVITGGNMDLEQLNTLF